MSLDYSLEKCAETVNTNAKVAEKYGQGALYSLSMLTMICGVPHLKTAKHIETLYDRGRAMEFIDKTNKEHWWAMLTEMQGFYTNANTKTDAQFAKDLLAHYVRNGEYERRVIVKGMDVKTA